MAISGKMEVIWYMLCIIYCREETYFNGFSPRLLILSLWMRNSISSRYTLFLDKNIEFSTLHSVILISRQSLEVVGSSLEVVGSSPTWVIFFHANSVDSCFFHQVDCESLSNSGLKSLGKYCKKLRRVDLQGVPFVDDDGLATIVENGMLEKLSLAECAVTDVTLRRIAKYCSSLVCISTVKIVCVAIIVASLSCFH